MYGAQTPEAYTSSLNSASSIPNPHSLPTTIRWRNGRKDALKQDCYSSSSCWDLQVPLDEIRFNKQTNEIVLGLGILLSWSKQMGVGTIGCLGGCECDSKDFSTYLAYSGWSMIFWEFVRAKVATPLPCSFQPLPLPLPPLPLPQSTAYLHFSSAMQSGPLGISPSTLPFVIKH